MGAVNVPRFERWDRTDHADWLDSSEPIDAHEPIENADAAEPMLPIDRNDPTDPIENAEPLDAMEQNEFFDHRLNPVRFTSTAERIVGEFAPEPLIVAGPEVR